MTTQQTTPVYAPAVLRFGMAALFLWFGLSQVINPSAWMSWLPERVLSIPWLGGTTIIFLNGTFETLGGILLAVGLWTRWAALLLSLHLFFIAYEIGYNDIGVRDFSLAVATLALSLFGPDRFTIDSKMGANRVSGNFGTQE